MTPQATLADFDGVDLTPLTPAETEAYVRVELAETVGPREFARQTGRSPGTVGNLLARAREKVDGGGQT